MEGGENSDPKLEEDHSSFEIAKRWCNAKGEGWEVVDKAGRGGTAPVYGIVTPNGERALKIYDEEFSTGERSRLQPERVQLQVGLGDHDCPSLVKVYEGGKFEERLFVLMSRAPGQELEKVLGVVPRDQIRHIVDQVARAVLFLRAKGLCHRDIKSANVFVSEDFQEVTLLDVSTVREISDPVGIGTDHGDQLPVVATARYSPPEYLFRLLDPGKDLWELLDTYQLGALLHDLIMRRPMFQAEYEAAKENRYRFAYAVATTTPAVEAEDVDGDLVFLAKRALVRDWRQRSGLGVEDFLADRKTRQANALSIFGIGRQARARRPRQLNQHFGRLMEVSREIESQVVAKLREQGVTAEHELRPTEDQRVSVSLKWVAPAAMEGEEGTDTIFTFSVAVTEEAGNLGFAVVTKLSGMAGDPTRSAELLIPAVADQSGAAKTLSRSIVEALRELAVKLTSADDEGEATQ